MSTLAALARAQAFDAGRAQPIATVRHVHLARRPLVFVPLALAGEACAPLAALVGDDPERPELLVVAQPRNRDQRFAFAAELGRIVLGHIEGFCGETEVVPGTRGQEDWLRYADAPQLWVPSRAGIGFTRLLGRSTRFRRSEGEHAVDPVVPALGRWLTFFAERSEHPGSCLLLAATEALALHWATGQSPVEDLNLASLVGWIDPAEGMSGLEMARAAEDPLRWPPAGPATDPSFDNEVLAGLIAACDRAEAAGDERSRERARAALAGELEGQLRPTWRLMWRAIELLRALPEGSRVAGRWTGDRSAFTWQAERLREGGPPQARRDSAVAAARRLARMERAADQYAVQRAFDDPLVMAEHRLTGEAFCGWVSEVERDRVTGSGRSPVLRPLVVVRAWDPVFAEAGARLTSPAWPGQKATVVAVTPPAAEGEPSEVVLELSGGMGRGLTAPAGKVPEPGEMVCYATFGEEYQPEPAFPDVEETPWTHGGPPAPYQPGEPYQPYQPSDEEAQEAWS